ncbi:MAG: M23 family metallopeptidase [Acidobacteriota bacterium]
MTRMLALALVAACGAPIVLSTYGSRLGANRLMRRGAHPGVDFAGARGEPVLAAMDGLVIDVSSSPASGGNCVVLQHAIRGRDWFTLYCHLEAIAVHAGDRVLRGDRIGDLGATGAGAGGVVHVHFQLCAEPCTAPSEDGELDHTLDPAPYTVGCFEPGALYDPDTLELTYPVRC